VKAPSVNNFNKLDHMAKRSPKLEAYYWRKERSPKQEANGWQRKTQNTYGCPRLEAYYWRKERSPKQEANGWQRKTQNTYGCPREAENMRTLTMLQIPVSLNNGSK
jgi:hypothetical protein